MLMLKLPEHCIIPLRIAAESLKERPQGINPHKLNYYEKNKYPVDKISNQLSSKHSLTAPI